MRGGVRGSVLGSVLGSVCHSPSQLHSTRGLLYMYTNTPATASPAVPTHMKYTKTSTLQLSRERRNGPPHGLEFADFRQL